MPDSDPGEEVTADGPTAEGKAEETEQDGAEAGTMGGAEAGERAAEGERDGLFGGRRPCT
jgi:hypothetical protein